MESCLSCKKYTSCNKQEKSFNFVCKQYAPRTIKGNADKYLDNLFAIEEAYNEGYTTTSSGILVPEEEDFSKLVDGMLGDNSIVPRSVTFDDRDLPDFPNFWKYVTAKNGAGVRPFARQLWIGIKLYGEYCPDCSQPGFFDDITNCPKKADIDTMDEAVQFLEHGICPKCKKTKLDFLRSKQIKPYNELAVVAGQRGGKSIMTSILTTYPTTQMIKLRKPTEVYGVLSNTTLTAIFVALTFKGAIDLLWSPVRDLMLDSPWYKQLHEMMDYQGGKSGQELYKVADTFIYYKFHKLLMYPAGPDKRKLRGKTSFITAIDELGWFHAGQDAEGLEKLNAEEVYTALDRTLKTLRVATKQLWKQGYYVPMATGYYVSSPSSYYDKIMSLYMNNVESNSTLAIKVPSWELNPNLSRKDFDKEFKSDPVKAQRDYGAEPPLASSPYIEDKDAIALTFKAGVQNRVTYKHESKDIGKELDRVAVTITQTKPNNPTPPSILAIDAGETNNSFVAIVGHFGKSSNKCVTDAIVEVIPRFGHEKVSFNRVYENVIKKLIADFNVKVLLADRWQSTFILDKVQEETKVETFKYSVKMADFDAVKSYIENDGILNPSLEDTIDNVMKPDKDNYPLNFRGKPASHLLLQMLTVESNKRTITKGVGLTDDIFRAYVLLHSHLLDEDFRDKWLKGESKRNTNLGIIAGIGTAGTSANKSSIVAGRGTMTAGKSSIGAKG